MELGKKKILLFTDWYEPGFKAGGPIQSCSNIVSSFSHIYSFYIFTSDRDFGETNAYSNVEADCWTTARNSARIWYASPGTVKATLLKKIVSDVQPDFLYFNSMFSGNFTLLPLWTLRNIYPDGKIILAPRGMLHAGALMQKTWKKKLFLQLLSWSGITRKIRFHATDEQEVRDIRRYFNRAGEIVMAENIPGMDTIPWNERDKQSGQLRCITVSRVHPKKNIHFAIQRMAAIRGSYSIQYDIYGLIEDRSYADQCLRIARDAGNCVQVHFKGPLTRAALFETLRGYHLFFLPTLGENFGHAIFEALSAGCPVLISDQTPWKNLTQHNAGWVIPLSDGGKFTEKLQWMCELDTEAFSKMSGDASRYAASYYAASDYAGKYFGLFS